MSKLQLYLNLELPLSINQLYINEYKFNPISKKREPTGARILSDKGIMNKKIIQKQAKRQLKKQEWNYLETQDKHIHYYMDVIIIFPKKGMDADNIFKILNDSLQGIVFDNDSRILPRTQKIMYDQNNPHIEVVITQVDYIGIFDNQKEHDEFIDNCETCKFYLNGRCSVLKNAVQGRIQDEIENMMCVKYTEKKGK